MKRPGVKFEVIAFDADDTLWENEPIFTNTQLKCKEILGHYVDTDLLEKTIYDTQIKNLSIFGYGIKGFTLSMIETAIELSEGKVTGSEVEQLIGLGKDMLTHPVDLLDGVRETIEKLKPHYKLMIITKGDLFDQESKIARSGLADLFDHVEILSEKNEASYQAVLDRYNYDPKTFLMVGNSLKSDILPLCEIGASALHIPFHTTWVHEQVEEKQLEGYEFWAANDIREVPDFLENEAVYS